VGFVGLLLAAVAWSPRSLLTKIVTSVSRELAHSKGCKLETWGSLL
jgi:hypothetical protein